MTEFCKIQETDMD